MTLASTMVLFRWTADSFAFTGWGWCTFLIFCGAIEEIGRRRS